MKILNNKVLIEEVKLSVKSGIQVASTAKSNYTMVKGKIIDFDSNLENTSKLKKGGEVLFTWGDKVNIESKDLYLVDYENIACIL